MDFPGKKYWSELPFSTPGHLPDTGIKPVSLVSSAFSGRFFTAVPPGMPPGECVVVSYCGFNLCFPDD